MITDLILFGEVRAGATVHVMDWMDFTKTITISVYYKNKDYFGLVITDLVTHLN